MAQRTIIQIAQAACDEMGIDRPTVLVNAPDPGTRQILAMINKVAEEMAKYNNQGWGVLQRLHTFTTVPNVSEYDLPDDYYREITNTAWNTSRRTPMDGTLTPAQWRAVKSGLFGIATFYQRFRIFRSPTEAIKKFTVDPVPSSAETVSFEYVSKSPFISSDGLSVYERVNASSDKFLLSETCLINGLKYYYRFENGLEASQHKKTYYDTVDREMGGDKPSSDIDLGSRGRSSFLLSERNFPDTGYGIPT